MQSKLKSVIRFNQREQKRALIGQIMLGLLMIAWIFEAGKEITKPNVVIIENTHAQVISTERETVEKEVASEDIVTDLLVIEEVNPASSVSDVEDIIRLEARKAGINEEGLLNLAHCESRFDPKSFNPTNGSGDRGIMQISKRWHPEVSDDVAYNPQKAAEWTVERIKAGYGYEWMCFWAYEESNYKRI